MGRPKLVNRSQPLVGRSSPYYEDIWRTYCCLTSFFPIVNTCLSCDRAQMAIFGDFLRPAFPASRVQHISDLHLKFALRPHHVCKYEPNMNVVKIYRTSKLRLRLSTHYPCYGPCLWAVITGVQRGLHLENSCRWPCSRATQSTLPVNTARGVHRHRLPTREHGLCLRPVNTGSVY